MDFLALERGNSNAARGRKLAAIKSFFNYLVDSEELKTNPARGIKSPKVAEREPSYLTEEECIKLLRTVAQEAKPRVRKRDMAMVILFLHTGLRVSELVNLELANVDLEGRQIKITRKGNKEQYLHLNRESVKALARYLSARPEAQDGRFFVGTKGQNLERTYVYDVVRKYLSLAGINKGKRGPHLLRHTFCTRLHQKGVSPFVIKDLAGHKSLSTTMRYVKIENREQTEALDKLEFGAI
jgi:site-specific recombinase XerD